MGDDGIQSPQERLLVLEDYWADRLTITFPKTAPLSCQSAYGNQKNKFLRHLKWSRVRVRIKSLVSHIGKLRVQNEIKHFGHYNKNIIISKKQIIQNSTSRRLISKINIFVAFKNCWRRDLLQSLLKRSYISWTFCNQKGMQTPRSMSYSRWCCPV